MDLHLRAAEIGGTHAVSATGEIDLATLPALQSALTRLVVEHPRETVAIDLDGVSSCDDTGLGILLGAAARARDAGGELVIVCTDPGLRARFARTRLDQVMTVAATFNAIGAAS